LQLLKTMDGLYNGRYFQASNDTDLLNMSSLGPTYPMGVIPPRDERAVKTARAFVEKYRGRIVGHGGSESGFPWSAGVLATIFARQGDGDTAWRIVESTRPAICVFGGMTEVIHEGEWNMQYFGTAQAAVVTAIHNLLLQAEGDTIRLFPAFPTAWDSARFDHLLAAGFEVSAALNSGGSVTCAVTNIAPARLTRSVVYRETATTVTLEPGETLQLAFAKESA
jgi:hypothetical protein